jgi:hypothetical protein|nr:hypothetical protein [Kofleriaceae bacterium]
MRRTALLVCLVGAAGAAACGGSLRRESVGRGAIGAQSPTPKLATGDYELALALDVPRAQVVAWTMSCDGHDVARGQVGETFEAYRARRLAELTKQRADKVGTAAAVVGLFVPRPKGVTVEAAVEVPPVTELPAGDVGAGRLTDKLTLEAVAGVCAVTAAVPGQWELTHVWDPDQQRRELASARRSDAIDARGRVEAWLVMDGAVDVRAEADDVRGRVLERLVAVGATVQRPTETVTGTEPATDTGATTTVTAVPPTGPTVVLVPVGAVVPVAPVRVIVKVKRPSGHR